MKRPLTALTLTALAATLAPAVAAADADAAVRPVRVRFDVRMLDDGGATMRQTGTFSGSPFGRGRVDIRSAVGGTTGAKITFLMTSSAGKLRGTGTVKLTFSGTNVRYSGTAAIVAGTRRYAKAHSRRLRLDGGGDMTGDHFSVVLSGRIAGL